LLLLIAAGVVLFRPGGLLNPDVQAAPVDSPSLAVTPTSEIDSPTEAPIVAADTPVKDTPAAAYTLEIKTPTTVPASVIKQSNLSQVIQVNRAERISVVKTEWMHDHDSIINAGSGAITFLNPADLTQQEKINMPGDVPLGMGVAESTNTLYILVGGNIKVYSLENYKLERSYPTSGGTNSIDVSQDGRLLALGISDNKVQILSADDGRVLNSFRSYYGGWSVAFSPDAALVAGGTSQGVLMWEVETGTWIGLDGGVGGTIKSLAFSNDGKMLAGGSDGILYIWNVETGKLLFSDDGQFGDILSLDFSPDDQLLMAGAEDGSVLLWNVSKGSISRTLVGHTSAVFSTRFSPTGQNIVTGANEGTIRIWGIP
jgi:WD40 repeat protein